MIDAGAAPDGCPLGMSDWPPGCLGFAVNLMRPTARDLRGTVLYPILGSALVFNTLQHAQTYRELCVQVRCLSCAWLHMLVARSCYAEPLGSCVLLRLFDRYVVKADREACAACRC